MDHKIIYYFNHFSRYFISKYGKICLWQPRLIFEESVPPFSTIDNSFDPEMIYKYDKGKIKFKITVSFIHANVVTLYIFYELDTWFRDLNTNFTFDNCLFGAVKLTKNSDSDKYDILVVVLDLLYVHNFTGQSVAGVKMLLFLVLIWAHLCLLIIRRKIS